MIPAWMPDTVTTDLDRAVHYTLLWGLDAVVLRTLGRAGDRVPFVNEERLRRRLAENDVAVAAVDPGLFEAPAAARAVWLNDLDTLAETAAFCSRIGCGLVFTGALAPEPESASDQRGVAAEALRQAGDAAARHGLRLAVRHAAGTGVATAAALADMLRAVGHPAVGALWQPAEGLAAGERSENGLAALRDTPGGVAAVTIPDTIGAEGGAAAWAPALHGLAEAGFAGPLVLEVHARPVGTAGLRAASALVRAARQARGAASGA